jgi:hypothetical protein
MSPNVRSTRRNHSAGGPENNGGNNNGGTGTSVGVGVNRENNNDLGGHANDGDGEDDNRRHYLDMGTCEEVEIAWLDSLTTAMNVQKAYDAVIKAEGANTLASTIRLGDYAYNIQILLTMAEGALTDGEMQMSRLDEYVNKKWIKKSNIKTTVVLMGKEINNNNRDVRGEPQSPRPGRGRLSLLRSKNMSMEMFRGGRSKSE